MRCPKCSFISYDLTETCVKCGKNISAASKELKGTIASIGAPAFLRIAVPEPEPEYGDESASSQDTEIAFDLGGAEEPVLDLGGEEGPAVEAGGLDLGLEEAEAAPAMDLGGPSLEEPLFAEPAMAEPQAAAFDIGALTPPQEELVTMAEPIEDLEFAAAAAPSPKAASGGLGLADLKVDGIDLEAAPAAGTGKVMPAVKTGTALDDFDIDLGDLIPKKK